MIKIVTRNFGNVHYAHFLFTHISEIVLSRKCGCSNLTKCIIHTYVHEIFGIFFASILLQYKKKIHRRRYINMAIFQITLKMGMCYCCNLAGKWKLHYVY